MTRFERNIVFIITGRKPEPIRKPARREGVARDEAYKEWIRTLPCSACGRHPRSEAAHVGHDGGMGLKCSDYWTIPLCVYCHRIGQESYHLAGRATFAAIWCLDYDALVQKYNGIWEQLQGVKIFGGGVA